MSYTAKLILLFILIMIVTANILALASPPGSFRLKTPVPSSSLYRQLWGFNWSAGLSLSWLSESIAVYWGNVEIVIREVAYPLLPNTPECLVHAWLYYRIDNPGHSPGVILVHGLGIDHTMFERLYP